MRIQLTVWFVALLALGTLLAGCPANQPTTKYKLHVCVTAPFPDYDLSGLVISPVSQPNTIDQTDSMHLIENNVLVVDGLVQGESYDLSIYVSTNLAISWYATGKTGVVNGDIHWLIYETSSGGFQTQVHTVPTQRTLKP